MGHLALAATGWASLGLGAFRRTATVAFRARIKLGKGNLFFQPDDGILEFDLQVIPQIVAALSAPAGRATAASPKGLLNKIVKDAAATCTAPEDIAEYLKWIVESTAGATRAPAGAGADAGTAATDPHT